MLSLKLLSHTSCLALGCFPVSSCCSSSTEALVNPGNNDDTLLRLVDNGDIRNVLQSIVDDSKEEVFMTLS